MNWRSFFDGMATINPFGNLRRRNPYTGKDPFEADREALAKDLQAVGQDMRRAIEKFEREHAEELADARKRRSRG